MLTRACLYADKGVALFRRVADVVQKRLISQAKRAIVYLRGGEEAGRGLRGM